MHVISNDFARKIASFYSITTENSHDLEESIDQEHLVKHAMGIILRENTEKACTTDYIVKSGAIVTVCRNLRLKFARSF